jgi:hypothetical protein|nr:MAG TPA: Baseplate structural protein [Caudoviricetes sp.]
MRITDLPALSAADLTGNDVVAVDHNTGSGIETRKLTWKNLLNKIYPVGSLYMSAKATSPAELFGGTWEQIKDRFILAAGDTYAAGSTGGEATHTLTVNEMPRHNHDHVMWYRDQKFGLNGRGGDVGSLRLEFSSADCTDGICTDFKGDSQPHNNLPPYLTAYIWRRIA